MNHLIRTTTLAAAFTAILPALAGAAGAVSYAQGRVLSATPVVEIVRRPVREEICYDERVVTRRVSSTPAVIGAILGGVVGNQFGSGSGRRAMTVAGAALGGSIGYDQALRGTHRAVHLERRCEPVTAYREEERVVAYRVEYEYGGQVFSTRTRHDPGASIDLRISVDPVRR